MKKLFSLFSSAAGFTMIELLIVITILGILAVAVLSAINPVEQINRGRDTGSRSDAEQLLSGIDRFNAFQGYYPWQINPNESTEVVWQTMNSGAGTALSDSAGCPIWEKLSIATTGGCTGTDELKQSFFTRIHASDYNPLYIYNAGTAGSSTYVCFEPMSAAFETEAAERVSLGLPSDYPAAATGNVDPEVCGEGGNCVCLP